jgi:YbbR domain-containing protein
MPRSALRFLRALFLEDLPLKFICLVLAVLFWFHIDGQLADERDLVVALTPADFSLPEGIEISPDRSLPEIEVRVRGPRRRLQYLNSRDIRFRAVLPSPTRGRHTVKLSRDLFRLAEGMSDVSVVGVKKDALEVDLIARNKRMKPVRVLTQGEVRAGFRLESAIPEPREVEVSSWQDLDNAEKILTEPIVIQDRTEDLQVTVGLAKTVQAGDREVEVSCPTKVRVTLKIIREEVARVLEDVPVSALVPPGAAMIVRPATVRVAIRGALEDVASLKNADLRLFVEWPADWDLQRPPGDSFPARSAQVKAIAPPRVTVRGENDQPLPTVKVYGTLTRPAIGP